MGHHLKRLAPGFKQIDRALPARTGVKGSDIVRSYLGLLVQGKSDFEAIGNFRGDAFFKHSLGIELLPSSATLRQRMDARATELFDFLPPLIETLLAGARPNYGVLACGCCRLLFIGERPVWTGWRPAALSRPHLPGRTRLPSRAA